MQKTSLYNPCRHISTCYLHVHPKAYNQSNTRKYKNRNTENSQVKPTSAQEYAEGLSDAFIGEPPNL